MRGARGEGSLRLVRRSFYLAILFSSGIASAQTTPVAMTPDEAAKAEAVARTFLEKVSGGNPAGTQASFDDAMRAALPPEKLSALWGKIQDQFGAFQALDKVTVKPNPVGSAAMMTTRFSRASAILKVVVNQNGQIAGFWYAPAWKPPSYVTSSSFTERAINVGSTPALPGHLAVPNGKGPFPLAILVHGSGPGDEDETVGENKPFKDLALGLASRGIAVMRYDKRTHVPPPPTPLTVQTEYFASVLEALRLARANPDIAPRRIVLIGHSQGAQLAPWLARDYPGLAGIALLAPPTRSPLDAAIEQLEQLAAQHPGNTQLAAQITALKHDRERLRSPDLRPDEMIFHAPGSYWMSLRGYDAVATAASLSIPIFVAQGERDYNVTVTGDYPQWQSGLAKKTNVVFKRYPNLNHLFITWGGTPSVEDNLHAGHVDKQLVDDLTAWILALPPAK
jgi:uncharacterized protein